MVALFHQKMKNNNNNNKKVPASRRSNEPIAPTQPHTHTHTYHQDAQSKELPEENKRIDFFLSSEDFPKEVKKIKQQQQQLARPGIGKNDGTSINRNEREPPPVYHLLFYYSLPF